MLELMILTMSVLPFVLGLYALKILEQRRRDDDDLPPPPGDDPFPPKDPLPVSPAGRRRPGDREPSRIQRAPMSLSISYRANRATPNTRDDINRLGRPSHSKPPAASDW